MLATWLCNNSDFREDPGTEPRRPLTWAKGIRAPKHCPGPVAKSRGGRGHKHQRCLQPYLAELCSHISGRAQSLLQKLLYSLQIPFKVLLQWLKLAAESATCRTPVTLLPDSQAPFILRILWLGRLSELSPSCFVTLKLMKGNESGSVVSFLVTGITPSFNHEHCSFTRVTGEVERIHLNVSSHT